MDTCFMKKYSNFSTKPLTHLTNLSIRNRRLPNEWKRAVVFKGGEHELICN